MFRSGATSGGQTDDANVKDAFFIIGNNLTIPIYPAITINTPANGSTATSSPAYNSSGTYDVGNTVTYLFPPLVDFNLTYHDTSTGQDLFTTLDAYNITATTTQGIINWSRSLPLNLANATVASSTYYQLVTRILSIPYLIPLATATSTFYVNITGSMLPQPYVYIGGSGTTVSTTTGQILNTCNSNNINILQSALCWLFIPRIETISQFGGLKTQIINKPPIGYLSAISNIITATTSTSTPLDALTVPTGSYSPFTMLRSALTWILWLVFGIFVLNRIRYLDLW
jgi:hypothetical protein